MVFPFAVLVALSTRAQASEDLLKLPIAAGRYGGVLQVAERSEPKTLNPLVALDAPSRDVIRRMTADLISINRRTFETEANLARSWTLSKDGRDFVVQLRRGLRFSDGQPFDADDVVFTFHAYLDENLHSPQRDLLIVAGQPITVEKTGPYEVRFHLAQPYAAAERIFDSVAILPRHLLETVWRDGKLGEAWRLNTPANQIAGLGPFRFKQYLPGEKIVLEKNPFYWKTDSSGNRLPYLDRLEFRVSAGEDAQLAQFLAGEISVLNRVNARDFEMLRTDSRTSHDQLQDVGPGFEYNFMFFKLGPVDASKYPEIAAHQKWFRDVAFRRAISSAVDRDAIVKLVYSGRATPLWGPVTPANAFWLNRSLPTPPRSIDEARQHLHNAGYRWDSDGTLHDPAGSIVEFSIVASSSSPERNKMATLIQDDLKHLGIHVNVVSLEFRALLDRVLHTRQYDTCILGLVGGDADPNPEMNVWLSSGGSHLWNPEQKQPMTGWEAEIDRLMRLQMTTLNRQERKRLYDRVQQLLWENQPLVSLVSPSILVAAKQGLANFHPAVLDHYTLWNVEQLYWKAGATQ